MKTKNNSLIGRKIVSTLDDVLKENGENKEVHVFEIGSIGMGKYGLNRDTNDYDIYCNIKVKDALKEMQIIQKVVETLDYRHAVNGDTFQPNGYKIIMNDREYTIVDWFDSLHFSRAKELDRSCQLYEKGNVSLILPRLENLISHKLDAFDPANTKHASDILEVWEINSENIDKKYLKKNIYKNGLQNKWSEVYRIYPRLSKKVGFPKKLV